MADNQPRDGGKSATLRDVREWLNIGGELPLDGCDCQVCLRLRRFDATVAELDAIAASADREARASGGNVAASVIRDRIRAVIGGDDARES